MTAWRPTHVPASEVGDCNAIADQWAREIDLAGAVARAWAESFGKGDLIAICLQCFIEGVYCGALNVASGTILAQRMVEARAARDAALAAPAPGLGPSPVRSPPRAERCEAAKGDPPKREEAAEPRDPLAEWQRARHPLLVELVRLIPPAGSVWPIEDRRRWLAAFAAGAALIYGPPDVAVSIERTPEDQTRNG